MSAVIPLKVAVEYRFVGDGLAFGVQKKGVTGVTDADLGNIGRQQGGCHADGEDTFQRRLAAHRQKRTVLLFQRVHVEGPLDDEQQHIRIDGLLVEVVRPRADGPNGIVEFAIAGHDDHFRVRGQLQRLFQRLQTLADAFGIRRQSEVLQNDGGLVAAQLSDRRFPIGCGEELVVLETPLQLTLDTRVVLDDQQLRLFIAQILTPYQACAPAGSEARATVLRGRRT